MVLRKRLALQRLKSTPTMLFAYLLFSPYPALTQTTSVQQAPAANQATQTTSAPAKQKPRHKPAKTTTTNPTQQELDDAVSKPEKPNLPRCSTEIANGNCYVNINRRYPYSYPGFLMKPRASVTINVFNPFGFEKLTLEPSAPANIYQSTDQFGSLLTAVSPGLKGANANAISTSSAFHLDDTFAAMVSENIIPKQDLHLVPTAEEKIDQAEDALNQLLTDAVNKYVTPYETFKNQTNEIYRQVRLASLAVPRPALDKPDQTQIGQTLFEPSKPDSVVDCTVPIDPWHSYDRWRGCMLRDLLIQGNSGTALWTLFPNKCQNPATPTGPWTVPVPKCNQQIDANGNPVTDSSNKPVYDSVKPLEAPHIDSDYGAKYDELISELKPFAKDPEHPLTPKDSATETVKKLFERGKNIKLRHDLIGNFLSGIMGAVPPTLTKISTDMQSFYIALLNAPDDSPESVTLGTLYGPSILSSNDKKERKYLGVPVGLAPSITYNVNGQNLITSSLLSAPATTQRTLIAAIPLTFAEPRFETSSGVFLSMLHNRTFANTTQVCINAPVSTPPPTPPTPTSPSVVCTPPPAGTAGVPTQQSVVISQTETNRPLIIPYFAAHYRILPEWTWLGGRRGALYATGALAINPYLTDLEYAAGLSFSWRYLIFSPVYHLGRSTHLTQGEQVGQIWCNYGGTSSATTVPPSCSGSPPTPTTKTYLTGAFAFGIGVRIPTTFSSTNK
jgi:hypothetical protein